MEVENTDQNELKSKNSVSDQSFRKNILNQKGNFLIIIGVVVLMLVIGAGVYYLGTKNKPTTSQGINPAQQVAPSTTTNTSTQSSFDNNVLIATKAKLQLINLITGDRKDFVDGEFISPGYLYHYNGIFSPDKKWILFKKDHNLWRASADGTDSKQLTTQGRPRTDAYWNIKIGNIKWSPDGQKIFYVVIVDNTGSGATKPHQTPPGTQEGLWVMDSNGSNQKYITQVKTPIEWMPDNKRVVFVEGNEYTSPTKTYDILTGEIKTLLPNTAIKNLFWSKKGDKGLYTDSHYEDSYLVDGNMQQIDVLTRQANTQYQGKSAFRLKKAYTISPDGKYALITERIRPPSEVLTGELDANLDVYLWYTNTKEKIKLPIKVSLHTKPFWSRDSQKIVYLKQYPETFYGNENGYLSHTGDLYYYDLATKKQTQVTTSKDIAPFGIEF